MKPQIIEAQMDLVDDYEGTICFDMGGKPFSLSFPIQCPNDFDPTHPHTLVKNGHAANTKAFKQQFLCKSCGRFFFIHTSRFFREFEVGLKSKLVKIFADGHFSSKHLATLFHWSDSTAINVIDMIMEQIASKKPEYLDKMGKIHARVLFMDETFLKIGGKTWYLIMGILDTGHILTVDLKEHRDQETLIKMVRSCEARLDGPLEMFITDGLSTYKGVALTFGHDLIHVRHIHQPPYGRIEIDAIKMLSERGNVKITTIITMNDIFQKGGCFLARVENRTISILHPPPKKRGRKAGGKNRSKKVINHEKFEKKRNKKKRGRPKKELPNSVHVFYMNKEKGCIQPWGESCQNAANILTSLYHVFDQKCITTNLIEKEFSVLKILICFRGRRSVARWMRLIQSYCLIRNNPLILDDVLNQITFSGIALQAAAVSQLTWNVNA